MKNYLIVIAFLFTLISCNKSFEILINPCRVCSYRTDTEKITEEVCDDTGNSEGLIVEMEERMQKKADAVNSILVCRNK